MPQSVLPQLRKYCVEDVVSTIVLYLQEMLAMLEPFSKWPPERIVFNVSAIKPHGSDHLLRDRNP